MENIRALLNFVNNFIRKEEVGPKFFEREKFWIRTCLLLQKRGNAKLLGRLLAVKEWLADNDYLTGLETKRRFEEELEEQMAAARRQGYSLTLLLLDIDNLKVLNDEKGHPAGDVFLGKLGMIIRQAKRKEDGAFRIGGDEMAIIASYTPTKKAEVLVRRLKREIQRLVEEKIYADLPKPLGVSFGKAQWDRKETKQELEKRVDEDLYKSKKLKKNG